MTISRRDTIIIAVLVNVGLLAVLFMTALQMEDDPIFDRPEKPVAAAETPVEPPVIQAVPQPIAKAPVDEIDEVINKAIAPPAPKEVVVVEEPAYIEITVKRGDALEKIARANGTTTRELKRINKLNNDTLSIGQILKVPASAAAKQEVVAAPETDDETYYILKSGDNPWKIARKFHVKYDDILRLNDFDEDNAKRLKPGDKIRVK